MHGLARAVERLGVTIYENTAVSTIEPGRLRPRGVRGARGSRGAGDGGVQLHGQKIVDAFGQGVLEVGLPDAAHDGIGRSGVRVDERMEVHHEAFPR